MLDAGMVGTEMLYFLVGSRELDGGLMCTASHNPKAYTGAKLVREGALALSGDAGIGDISRARAPPACREPDGAPGSAEEVDVYARVPRATRSSFIDPAAIRPLKIVLDGGNGMAGPDGRADPRAARRAGAGPDLLGARRRVPRPRAQPAAAREPPLRDREGAAARAPTSASRGTATPTAASSSTAAGEFVDGDFLCALLARSVLESHPGADILYDVRASRAVADTVAAAGGNALVNRVGHAFFKTRMREEGGAFGGEVSGHYYFADFYNADSGTLPALLILELLGKSGRTLAELLEPYRSRYFISGEINSEVVRPGGQAGRDPRALRATPRSASSTASRSTTRTGTSTCARRTPSRCCACAWRASSRRAHGGQARRGAQPDPELSASSTAATAGRRSAPARVAAKTWRAGRRVGERADDRARRTAAWPRRGTSVTPRPAAASAIAVWKSSVRCAEGRARSRRRRSR